MLVIPGSQEAGASSSFLVHCVKQRVQKIIRWGVEFSETSQLLRSILTKLGSVKPGGLFLFGSA